MEVLFGILFLMVTCYMLGYFVGYNNGFEKRDKIHRKIWGNTEIERI